MRNVTILDTSYIKYDATDDSLFIVKTDNGEIATGLVQRELTLCTCIS